MGGTEGSEPGGTARGDLGVQHLRCPTRGPAATCGSWLPDTRQVRQELDFPFNFNVFKLQFK